MTALYTEKQPEPQPQPEATQTPSAPEPAEKPKPARLVSLDAYRGFIMLAMASGGLALAAAAKYYPGDRLWEIVAYNAGHVPWVGGGFWDMIQPAFMFMVGVALPYSLAHRKARGDSSFKLWAHALWRSLLLIALGVFLSSNWNKQTNWTFINVLSQIGLAYPFLFLLGGRGLMTQLVALVLILGGYWALFFWYPAPPANFDWVAVGVPATGWEHPTGLLAHWDKGSNVGADLDVMFMSFFPREKPFVFNDGGYVTLNFVPSLATMILGLMAGEYLLRSTAKPTRKTVVLLVAGAVCLGLGLVAGMYVCPIVKRIWTPSWVLYSGGIVMAMLAVFYWVIDVQGWKKWAFPLVVVGMNSIAMYCMAQLMKGWIGDSLARHGARHWFELVPFGATLKAAVVLFILWLICLWMYRRKVFLKI
jgi:predicted acyltransferase